MTTGCTVPVGAVTGVGVDALGRPVGYLRVCHDRIDGATLYHGVGDAESEDGSWITRTPVTSFATWSLAEPASTWSADPALGDLGLGVEYTLYGWTNDNSSSAGDVTFTVDELRRLEPGQVLYWTGKTTKVGYRTINVAVSESTFRDDACEMLE